MLRPLSSLHLLVTVPVFFILLVVISGAFFIPQIIFRGLVLPGVSLAGVDLGRATEDEAIDLVATLTDETNLKPIELQFDGGVWQIDPTSFDLKVQPERLAHAAFLVSRRGGLIQRVTESWAGLFSIRQPLVVQDESLYNFDKTVLTEKLRPLAEAINQPRRDAKLKVANDRVMEFVSPQNGQELDIAQTISLITGSILSDNRKITLPVKVVAPTTTLAGTNSLGVNTLIGRGESDFSGSPKNRRHNISVGASKFDGLLVEPGETFSFLKHLGEVDQSTGYLPELVIKGDKTIPEFGGGLCQVSTTAFRAILRSGLPVVERRNHSYRVVYYEPAGSDATIYQPAPDLKFTDDTGGHIFIDTYIDGNKLYFDFYGTDTGRTVELDGPHIFNVTDYPEPIYIDTTTLPVGETKKVDTAHRGADAVLYRKIFEGGKLIRTDAFSSHYIPWPAKYLRGAEDATKVETNLENIGDQVPTTNPPTTL